MPYLSINTHKFGFTLIEVLVTISLLGIILGSSTVLFKTVISNNKKSQSLNLLRGQGQQILETVTRIAIGAKSITDPNNPDPKTNQMTNRSYSKLSFTDLANNTTTITCEISADVSTNKIIVTKAGVSTLLVGQDPKITVDSCSFTGLNSSTLTFSFILLSNTGGESQQFSTNIVARNIKNQ